MGVPTYVRTDNADAAYQVDSANSATDEKRLNGLLERNRGELGKNEWLVVVYIPGDINTSDGLSKSLYTVNLGNLLGGNTLRIVTEERGEIRRKYLNLSTTLCIMRQFMGGFEHRDATHGARMATLANCGEICFRH